LTELRQEAEAAHASSSGFQRQLKEAEEVRGFFYKNPTACLL